MTTEQLNYNAITMAKIWILSNVIVNFFFTLELIADFAVYGLVKAYTHSMRCWQETICLFVNLWVVLEFFRVYDHDTVFNPILYNKA